MKPLFSIVVIGLLIAHSHQEEEKELTKSKQPAIEDESTDTNARSERCTVCSSGQIKINPKDVLASIQALPGEVHTQSSYEGCSSDKGCAGIKVKDGRVVERFGNTDAFRAAAASDADNEFTFHAAGNIGNLFGPGLAGENPFWWMNQHSPFKNAANGGSFEKFSKSSSSFSSSGNGGGLAGGVDLSANPFLNGDITGSFSSDSSSFSSSGANGAGVEQAKPFQSNYESSSFSSVSKGELDLANNPFLNGGVKLGGFQGFNEGFGSQASYNSNSKFGAGYTGSSPRPFTAGANVNLIQNTQKASEFDYEQQNQQNIDEAFRNTGNVQTLEHSGGDLQQTCSGQGYICVHKAQCNNGVVNSNGGNLLQANTQKQYCNTRTEVCCRIELSNLSGASGQGSLGVGSATFTSNGQNLFQTTGSFGQAESSNDFSQTASTNGFGQSTNGFGQSSNGFGQSSNGYGQSASSNSGYGQTATTKTGFGQTVSSSNGFGQTATSNNGFGQTLSGSNTGFGQGSSNFGQGSTTAFGQKTTSSGFGQTASTSGFGQGSGSSGYGQSGFGQNSQTGSYGSNFKGNTGSGFTATGSFGSATRSTNRGAVDTSYGAGFDSTVPSISANRVGANGYNNEVYKSTSQSNFIERDSFSSGSNTAGIYRPGSGPGLKPGIPYLPPVDTNIVSTTASTTYASTPRPIQPRPFTTPKQPYQPPVTTSTTAPGYFPPIAEPSNNQETRVPNPFYNNGGLISDETLPPPTRPNEIPAGCAAALKCTPIEFCTADGVISNTSVALTRDQESYRVPLTDCKDIVSGRVGKCCRDPYYTDPWPTNQLGKWVPGVFGGNDGRYVPDNRGSPSTNFGFSTVRPPTTGSVYLNNFRNPTKPTVPAFGPNQITPGYPTVTPSTFVQKTQTQTQTQYGEGQIGFGNQGQVGVIGIGQGSKGSQGQYGSGSQFTQTTTAFGQRGQGQSGTNFGITQGQGQIVTEGQGVGITQGQGQLVTQNTGSYGVQGQGQIVKQGIGFGVTQGGGYGVIGQGQGQSVTQGQGTGLKTGQGFGITQGFGVVGQGQGFTQGQGSGIKQGTGFGFNQGQGFGVSQNQGFGITQGQGYGVKQGQGFGLINGQGGLVTGGGSGTLSFGIGQAITQGKGEQVTKGQGQIITQGQETDVEYEPSESTVTRVFLKKYDGGGGQCGRMNGQRPFGNRNDFEVDFAEIPWQAMVLLQTNKSLLCGAVITRPDAVITTASCVEGLKAQNILIKGGEWKLGIDDEPQPFQIVPVKTIVVHPFYKKGSLLYDAAILELKEDLRFSANVQPICLPGAQETLDAYYNGAGECIVTGWGKVVLQAHLSGSIMHSVNVSLLNPGECQTQLSQNYPHLLDQYSEDSCVCGQPTNPAASICKVDIGSALACTTGDGHFTLRGIYSWDSGCQLGNQLAGFFRFDVEWYQWAIGIVESVRFATFGIGTQVTQKQYTGITGQINSQIKSSYTSGVKGSYSGVKGGIAGFGTGIGGVNGAITSFDSGVKGGIGGVKTTGSNFGITTGVGKFGQFNQFGAEKVEKGSSTSGIHFGTSSVSLPVSNAFSATYSEKKVFQTEPKFVTYTTKPEIVTFTTKPEYFTFTTKPKIVTYTTKPKIVTYTTKPEIVTYTTKPEIFTYTTKPEIFTYTTKPKIINYTTKPQFFTYETSGSNDNPTYVAPDSSFKPTFSEVIGHKHDEQCKCLQNGKK